MARMPGAIWKPLAANWASQPRMRAYDFFCIHTMVGSLDGTDGFFKVGNGTGYGGTESHFGVGPDGTIYQWQDTDFQADANGNGNWHVISSENADTGAPFPKWAGSDVPPLTPQQVEANARIALWLHRTHGIPLGIAGNSKPGSRGLAVHRYGVPGYMPAGAEQWSTSQGKACPGDRRIAQLPAISARAQQLLGGASIQEDDVSAADVFNTPIHYVLPDGTPAHMSFGEFCQALVHRTQAVNRGGEMIPMLQEIADAKSNTLQIVAKLDAITEVTKTLAAARGGDIDVPALLTRIDERIAAGFAEGVDVRVTVGDPATGPTT